MKIEHMLLVLLVVAGLYLIATGNPSVNHAWFNMLHAFGVTPSPLNIWTH